MASLPLPIPAPQTISFLGSKSPAAIVGVEAPARLTALEWSVVAMAEQDRLSSLREPSRFVSALNSLFGLRRANRLANDRLEALRRIAVLAWHHRWNVPKSELHVFLAAGFSVDQYELIQASIGRARAAVRQGKRR